MIRVDFHVAIKEESVFNIIALAAGLSVIAKPSLNQDKDEDFKFNWRSKISKDNYAFLQISEDGKTSIDNNYLFSEDGDILYRIPSCIGFNIAMLLTTVANKQEKNEYQKRSLYFIEDNTYNIALALKLLNKVGGKLWVNDELMETVPLDNLFADRSSNDDIYYSQKNSVYSIKPVNKNDMLDVMRKYSYINNSDESLSLVATCLDYMDKNIMKTKKIKLNK